MQAQSGGNAEELLKERQGDVTPEELVQAIVTGDREIGEWIVSRALMKGRLQVDRFLFVLSDYSRRIA